MEAEGYQEGLAIGRSGTGTMRECQSRTVKRHRDRIQPHTMPSASASTLVDNTKYLNSCKPPTRSPFCGPSRKRFSKTDLRRPKPDLLGGRFCDFAARPSCSPVALLDLARRRVEGEPACSDRECSSGNCGTARFCA